MKKIIYISIVASLMLFSCSKEEPLSITSTSQKVESTNASEDIGTSTTSNNSTSNSDIVIDDVTITDPEKEDNEKTNKKAKN